MCVLSCAIYRYGGYGKALMRALMAVENDGGEALQAYLVHEHEESSNGKDGSTLMPEAMRARARVPRYETFNSQRLLPCATRSLLQCARIHRVNRRKSYRYGLCCCHSH